MGFQLGGSPLLKGWKHFAFPHLKMGPNGVRRRELGIKEQKYVRECGGAPTTAKFCGAAVTAMTTVLDGGPLEHLISEKRGRSVRATLFVTVHTFSVSIIEGPEIGIYRELFSTKVGRWDRGNIILCWVLISVASIFRAALVNGNGGERAGRSRYEREP